MRSTTTIATTRTGVHINEGFAKFEENVYDLGVLKSTRVQLRLSSRATRYTLLKLVELIDIGVGMPQSYCPSRSKAKSTKS